MLLRLLAVLVACVAAPAAAVRAQTPTFPPGARVGLVAPSGFAPAAGFVGFEDQTAGGAIVIGDLPRATFDEMLPTFTPEGVAKGGIRATQPAAPWPVPDGEGRILRGVQESRGVAYRRWLVLVRTKDAAAMVSAMVPDASGDAATPAVEAALRTISFRPPPSLDERVAALPFRVGDRAGFRPVLADGGVSLLLTEGPSDRPQAATQPVVYLVAHGSGAQGGPAANAALARDMFARTPTLRSVVPTKAEDRDGTSRIEGTGVEAATGADVEVVQVVRFENGGYVRAVGIWRRGEASRHRGRFERLEASVRPR